MSMAIVVGGCVLAVLVVLKYILTGHWTGVVDAQGTGGLLRQGCHLSLRCMQIAAITQTTPTAVRPSQ